MKNETVIISDIKLFSKKIVLGAYTFSGKNKLPWVVILSSCKVELEDCKLAVCSWKCKEKIANRQYIVGNVEEKNGNCCSLLENAELKNANLANIAIF